MEFTGLPRHQLRAMGRSKGRFSSRPPQTVTASGPHSGVRTPAAKPTGMGHTVERVRLAAAPECPEAKALLDYLSGAASDLTRDVVNPETLPPFAQISTPSVIVPPQRQRTVADDWSPTVAAKPAVQPILNRNFGLAEGALQGLADLLTLEAGSVRESAGRPTIEKVAPEFVQCVKPPVELLTGRQSSYELLNSWLNTGKDNSASATADDDEDMIAYSLDEIQTVSLYAGEDSGEYQAQRFLGSMSSSIENAQSADQLLAAPNNLVTGASPAAGNLAAGALHAPLADDHRHPHPDTHVGPALSRNHSEAEPKLQMLPAGRRMESLDNGAQIIKDSLGRVIEVRSPLGPVLRTRYDENGHLRFFVRTDKEGNIQSYGESDKQGVVVHDPEGRVRAAGESMAIDRVGRLSIVRKDGQFWSIDLARGLHLERRQMVDEDGQWKAITAVFAYDGFRMVTRFQSMESREFDEEEGCYLPSVGSVVKEEIRLYGRDGSCVQFDSEDAIEELRPSRVWPPASRAVDKKYRNRWQAGTAWQAVREYLELLKSGSG